MRNLISQRKLLSFAALVELATGVFLVVAPSLVIELLLGSRPSSAGVPVCRIAGLVMLGFGLAAWPNPSPTDSRAAFRGMLLYNALVALYLAFLATVRHAGGLLLWPAVVLHAFVALLLVWTWRQERSAAR
ncbi:MAG: hypothetical protein ACLQDQ_02030 [Myxococcaceae bacterium]